MENEYGSFGADEIDVKYMKHLKTVRKSFYDQESKLSTRDQAFFFFFGGGGGGGMVGKEQRPKGKKRNALYNFTKFKSPADPTVL